MKLNLAQYLCTNITSRWFRDRRNVTTPRWKGKLYVSLCPRMFKLNGTNRGIEEWKLKKGIALSSICFPCIVPGTVNRIEWSAREWKKKRKNSFPGIYSVFRTPGSLVFPFNFSRLLKPEIFLCDIQIKILSIFHRSVSKENSSIEWHNTSNFQFIPKRHLTWIGTSFQVKGLNS